MLIPSRAILGEVNAPAVSAEEHVTVAVRADCVKPLCYRCWRRQGTEQDPR